MKQCVAKALERKKLQPDQPFKVELVEGTPEWKALRLSTKGCATSVFRGIAKERVVAEDTADVRT